MTKAIQKKVYEGDVIQPVKVLGVTLRADAATVDNYNQSVARAKQALSRLKVATRLWRTPDEKNVIDQ